MHGRFSRGVASADLPAASTDTGAVTEEDLARLPAVVQRYLRFMGVVGRPRDWSFRARYTGRFRLRPGEPWWLSTRGSTTRRSPSLVSFTCGSDSLASYPYSAGTRK
jgi:hypothetical protein